MNAAGSSISPTLSEMGGEVKASCSNRRLYERLGGALLPRPGEEDPLADLLQANRTRFEKLLQYYQPPSSASRTKVQDLPTVSVGEADGVKLSRPTAQIILAFSDLVQLDEVQALNVFQNYVAHRFLASDRLPDVEELQRYYYEERLYLLEAVVSLLRYDETTAGATITRLVEELLRGGLLDTTLEQYKQGTDQKSRVPAHLNQEQALLWANQGVAEQAGLLRILFYLFFGDHYGDDTLLRLYDHFAANDFGSKQPHFALLSEEGRATVAACHSLCALILVEALQLEQLYSEEESVQQQHFLVQNPQLATQLRERVEPWVQHPLPHHGPVLLAWTAAIFQLQPRVAPGEAPRTHGGGEANGPPSRWDYTVILAAALNCGALSSLYFLLQSSSLSRDEANLVAYKSVSRGLVLALFSAFQVDALLQHDASLIVDLYCALFRGQAELCEIFWEEDYGSPTRGAILQTTKSEFPRHPLLFLRVVASLGESAPFARKVFHYMERLDTLTVTRQAKHQQYLLIQGNTAHVSQPFYCQGVLLPYGTRGTLLPDGGIMWSGFVYSGWVSLHHSLLAFAKRLDRGEDLMLNSQGEPIVALLNLVHTLVSQDSALAVRMQQQIPERKPTWVHLFLMVFTQLSFVYSAGELPPTVAQILSLTIHCLTDFAPTHAREIWMSSLVSGSMRGVHGHTTGGPSALLHTMHSLLQRHELPSGRFELTIPALRLLRLLLLYVQHWDLPLEDSALSQQQNFGRYLDYVCRHLFVPFSSWRFTKAPECWEMGRQLMQLLLLVLTDVSQSSRASARNELSSSFQQLQATPGAYERTEQSFSFGQLKDTLLQALLYDSSYHGVILNIISGASASLVMLRSARAVMTELKILEDLVLCAFQVLERVLVEREGISQGESSLEHALMGYAGTGDNRTGGNFIVVISSFVLYRYRPALPLVASRVFCALCKLSLLSSEYAQRRPSIVAYLGSEASSVCAQFMQLLQGDHQRHEELHQEIVQFVTTTLEYQLGMAEMFLQLDKPPTNTGPVSIVRDFLTSPDTLTTQPTLCATSFAMLHALWACAPDHLVVRTHLREHEAFWEALFRPLRALEHIRAPGPATGEEAWCSAADQTLLFSISTWAFRILTLELYLDPGALSRFQGMKAVDLSAFLQESLLPACTAICRNPFDGTPIQQLVDFTATHHIDLELFTDHANVCTFAPAPLYDVALARRKLFDTSELKLFVSSTRTTDQAMALAEEFVELLQQVNETVALYEAQLCAFDSLQRLLRLACRSTGQGGSHLQALAADMPWSDLIHMLATIMVSEDPRFRPSLQRLNQFSELLVVLIRQVASCPESIPRDMVFVSIAQDLRTVVEKVLDVMAEEGTQMDEERSSQSSALIAQNLLTSILMLMSPPFLPDSTETHLDQERDRLLLQLIGPLAHALPCPVLEDSAYLLLSLITRRVHDKDVLVSCLRKHELFEYVVTALEGLLQQGGARATAHSALPFLQALASESLTAQQLVAHNVFFVLCDNSLHFFSTPFEEAYVDQKRNPLHQLWCQILRLVSQLALSLSTKDPTSRQLLLRFLVIHQSLLLRKWTLFEPLQSKSESEALLSLPLGVLEELSAVTELYSRWAVRLEGWQLVLTPQNRDIAYHVRFLLHYVVLSLLKPHHLRSLCRPVSDQEHQQMKGSSSPSSSTSQELEKSKSTPPVTPPSPLLGATSLRTSLSLTSSDNNLWKHFEKEESSEDHAGFYGTVQLRMHEIISHSLVFLSQFAPKLWSSHFDPSHLHVFFEPGLEASMPPSPPCLGVLLYCTLLCSRVLQDTKTGPLYQLCILNYQQALALLLLQVSVYPLLQEQFRDLDPVRLGNELRGFMERLLPRVPSKPAALKEMVVYTLNNLKHMFPQDSS